jgi:hypothetical protein
MRRKLTYRAAALATAFGFVILSSVPRVAEAQTPTASHPPVLSVTAYDRGFDVSSVTLRPGPVYLLLFHHAHSGPLSFTLNSDEGAAVVSPQIHQVLSRWVGEVNLVPGRYSLRESNHQAWSLAITVADGSN